MKRRSMLHFALIGIGLAEVIFAAGYFWLRYRYSVEIELRLGLLWPIVLVALIGACVGALTWLIRRNPTLD